MFICTSKHGKYKNRKKRYSESHYNPEGYKTKKQKRAALREDKLYVQKQAKLLKPTASEIEFAKKLDILGIKYEQQYPMSKRGFSAIYDFYVKDLNMFIEIDGPVHYSYNSRKKDWAKDRATFELFWIKVVRFTNNEAVSMTPDEIKDRLFYKRTQYKKNL